MGLLSIFPRFSHVLCCIELQTGSIVIALLLLVYHALNFGRYVIKFVDHGGFDVKDEWLNALVFTLGVIFALYLLLGAIKRNANHMSWYLYFKLVFLVYILITIITALIDGRRDNDLWNVIAIWLIEGYFWLCVNSYYLSIGGD